MADITWTRGDTKDLVMTIMYKPPGSSAYVGRNLDDCTSVTICLNTEAKPEDATNEVWKEVGTPDANQVDNPGRISFNMDGNEDYLGKYYYDIQAIISAKKDTFIKGSSFTYEQDINKD